MHIDDYDDRGRTALMNAAIAGNVEEVERLLKAGANPLLADRDFGTTTAEGYAARYAKNSEDHQRIREILRSCAASQEEINQSPRHDFLGPEPDEVIPKKPKDNVEQVPWPLELRVTRRGEQFKRLRTSFFYIAAAITFSIGLYLIEEEFLVGFLLSFTVTLCLILYPIIRFLFGGKDSLAAGIATVLAEELLKSQITKKLDSSRRRRKR